MKFGSFLHTLEIFFMPAHNFRMATNGAQELEIFDSLEHKTSYAYVPIMK